MIKALGFDTHVSIIDAEISRNSAGLNQPDDKAYAGVLMVLDNASFDIQGTTFEENSCAFGSTIQLTSNKGPTSVIKDSTFRKNIGDGLMVIYDSKMDVENTTFEDNISTESTTAIKITHSVFNMKNNRFRNTK